MLITAVGLVDEPEDHTSFTPMLDQAEETTGSKAPMTLADAGYYSGTNLEDCAGRDQAVAMPESSRRQSRDHPYHKDRFAYDESNDSFMCPQGKALPFKRIHLPPNGVHYRFYQAPGAVCRACPAFGVCTKSKDGRNVTVGPNDAALRRHRTWMATSAATEVYKLRKQVVEPVFGIIKEQQAGRRFLLRGLLNVAAEWTVLATAFNLRTLCRVWRSRIFEPGIWAVAVSLSVALGTSPRLVNRVDDTCSSVLFYPSPISAWSWEGQWVAIDLSSLPIPHYS